MSANEIEEYAADVTKNLLKNSPLGVELSDDQCATLGGIIKFRRLRANDLLLEESHIDDTLYVIVSGKLEAIKYDQAGESVSLHIHEPNDIVGEMGFIDGAPHSATLRAISDSVVFTLHRKEFESLVAKDPELIYKVMRSMMRTVHKILRRMNFQYVQLTDYIQHQHGRY